MHTVRNHVQHLMTKLGAHSKLQAVATTGYTERIFVRGDGNAPYGVMADVMSRIQAGGFTNIGLVTEQKSDR